MRRIRRHGPIVISGTLDKFQNISISSGTNSDSLSRRGSYSGSVYARFPRVCFIRERNGVNY